MRVRSIGFFFVLATAAVVAAPAHSDTVIACGSSLTESVTLDHDIGPCSEGALTVVGGDVTIDFNGHSITGSGRGNGMLITVLADGTAAARLRHERNRLRVRDRRRRARRKAQPADVTNRGSLQSTASKSVPIELGSRPSALPGVRRRSPFTGTGFHGNSGDGITDGDCRSDFHPGAITSPGMVGLALADLSTLFDGSQTTSF